MGIKVARLAAKLYLAEVEAKRQARILLAERESLDKAWAIFRSQSSAKASDPAHHEKALSVAHTLGLREGYESGRADGRASVMAEVANCLSEQGINVKWEELPL